jgi:hypothetical protein
MRDEATGQFLSDVPSENRMPVGTVRIRTRHKRGGDTRAFVKVADPNVWRLRAHLVWEEAHGAIPTGLSVHHKDRDTLNDALSNLELLSKKEHLAEHRSEYKERAIAGFVKTRRERRWSTKSATKRTGRPPAWKDSDMDAAVAAVVAGAKGVDAAKEFNVHVATLMKRARAIKAK